MASSRLLRSTAWPFLRRPVSAARVVCGSQPVAAISSASVAPSSRRSRARTLSVLLVRAGQRRGRGCGCWLAASLWLDADRGQSGRGGEHAVAGVAVGAVDGGGVGGLAFFGEAALEQRGDRLACAACLHGGGQGQDAEGVALGGGGQQDRLRVAELGHDEVSGREPRHCRSHRRRPRRSRDQRGGAGVSAPASRAALSLWLGMKSSGRTSKIDTRRRPAGCLAAS